MTNLACFVLWRKRYMPCGSAQDCDEKKAGLRYAEAVFHGTFFV